MHVVHVFLIIGHALLSRKGKEEEGESERKRAHCGRFSAFSPGVSVESPVEPAGLLWTVFPDFSPALLPTVAISDLQPS